MSYLKKIGALFVSSALMAAMLTGCGGSSSASTGDSGVMLWGLLLTAAAGMIAVMAVSRRKETRGE